MKPATSNLACNWCLPRPIIKYYQKNSGCGPGLRDLFNILGFPYNISAMTEASDLKFGAQLGFAKDHHKVARRRKWGVALDWELAKIWSFPFNIYRMAEASDFNFGTQLGFAKAHHKITPIGKSGCRLGLGSSTNISGSPLIFLQRLRCPLNVSGSSCTCIT